MTVTKTLVRVSIIVALIALISSTHGSQQITSPPDTDWGIWGDMEYCPNNRFAQGFQLKTEPNQFTGDDTALNAIRLFCGDPERPDTAVISSTQGDFGAWGQRFSCYPGLLTGFQLRVEGPQIGGDDTATNNVRFFCNGHPDPIEGDGLAWGLWREAQHCGQFQGICGIQTQVEPVQLTGDDTMLNRLRVECCDLLDPNVKVAAVAAEV